MALTALSRRERQIMDVLFRTEEATAREVQDALPDAPSYSAVRALLRILEEKGHVTHRKDGVRYVYQPAVAPEKAQRSALRHVVKTFFSGAPEDAMAALLDTSDLDAAALDRLAEQIERAKREGR